jgi:DNA-binding transcriptional LysR family regulator
MWLGRRRTCNPSSGTPQSAVEPVSVSAANSRRETVSERQRPEDMESEMLFGDRLLVVAGLGNKWASRRRIEFHELLGEPWTLPPVGSLAATLIADAFQSARLPTPRATVPSSSISVNIHLVAAGRFLSVLPESMIRFSAKHLPLEVLRIDLPVQSRPVVIATLKNRTLNPVAKLFIESTRAAIRPLVNSKNRRNGVVGMS